MKFCLPFSAGIPVNVKNSFLFQLSLAVLATLLHALAFPNPLLANGLWPAGFIAYLPLFMLVRTAHWRYCAVTGAAYGFLSTVFFNYWLAGFHPLALPLAASIKLVYNAFFFIALRYAARIFPRYAAVLQTLFWVVFEYLQSLGFLGYTYGFAGYTQWRNIPLLQTASLTGVWGVSALVVFPQAWLAGAWAGTPSAIFKPRIPIALYAAILVFCLCRGAFFIPESGEERGDAPVRRIALIQQNDNPWKDSPDAYRQTLVSLIKLSNEALAGEQTENKNERNLSAPALVVWPETAFVPMFYWHIRYRTDHAYYTLVKELSDYLKKQDAFFLIGNDDGRREERDGALVRVDYNAALFFDGGELAGVYRK
ncbi:MAG: apolipoprotein N-acyltransferase, partial [Spirochaetaceae bacterium]|nr:apolipoprotein N-acyltransferase [Spirochaetaceae bacterium]